MKTILRFISFLGLALIINGCSIFSEEDHSAELTLLWEYSYNNPDGYDPNTLPVIIQENAILTSGDKSITLLEIETGNLIWKTDSDAAGPLRTRNFGLNSEMITGAAERVFYAWNKNNGELLWKLNIPDSISWNYGRPIIAESDDLFLMTGPGTELYFIDSEGNIEFQKTAYYNGLSVLTEDTLYLGQKKNDYNGIFSVYDATTMNLLWQFEDDKLGFFRIPPIIENGTVYLFTSEGAFDTGHNTIFALDTKTGSEIWRHEDLSANHNIVKEDFIFGVGHTFVWALDKNDGTLLWKIQDFSAGSTKGNLAFWDGYLYIPFTKGLLVLDAENGSRVHLDKSVNTWNYKMVVAGNGKIFAQTNHKLYAFAPWGHQGPLE